MIHMYRCVCVYIYIYVHPHISYLTYYRSVQDILLPAGAAGRKKEGGGDGMWMMII